MARSGNTRWLVLAASVLVLVFLAACGGSAHASHSTSVAALPSTVGAAGPSANASQPSLAEPSQPSDTCSPGDVVCEQDPQGTCSPGDAVCEASYGAPPPDSNAPPPNSAWTQQQWQAAWALTGAGSDATTACQLKSVAIGDSDYDGAMTVMRALKANPGADGPTLVDYLTHHGLSYSDASVDVASVQGAIDSDYGGC